MEQEGLGDVSGTDPLRALEVRERARHASHCLDGPSREAPLGSGPSEQLQATTVRTCRSVQGLGPESPVRHGLAPCLARGAGALQERVSSSVRQAVVGCLLWGSFAALPSSGSLLGGSRAGPHRSPRAARRVRTVPTAPPDLRGGIDEETVRGGRIEVHEEVEPVEEWSAEACAVPAPRGGMTGAAARRVPVPPARAGVHGRDEQDAGGVLHVLASACDPDLASFERLA